MTGPELVAVLTAAAALVGAIAALVRAWRTNTQVQAHVQEHMQMTTRSARPARPAGSPEQ